MTPAILEAGGVELAYDEQGDGPAVVLVHGTATTRASWRELLDRLGPDLRAIAYDRRAYGDSGAPEPYGGTTAGEQADDLADLIEALDAAPAVVCGHELGALACLDLLVRRGRLVAGAVLIEPPMLWLSPVGTDTVAELREAVATAARERGPGAAVEAFLETTGGPDGLALLGEERAAAARANARAFAADLAAAASWSAGRRELRAIDKPVTLVTGTRSDPVRNEATRELAALLPRARLVETEGGHFAQLEQPGELAAEITALARGGGGV